MALEHDDHCRLNAPPDEPRFTLRAQDFSSPYLVRLWARMNRGTITVEKYDEAMKCANDMEAWHTRKWAD